MSKIQQYKDLITGKSKAQAMDNLKNIKTVLDYEKNDYRHAIKNNGDIYGIKRNLSRYGNDLKRESANLKKVTNATTGARLGTALAGATALGAGAYGLKKLHDKKKQEKTAFDIVNDTFEKL